MIRYKAYTNTKKHKHKTIIKKKVVEIYLQEKFIQIIYHDHLHVCSLSEFLESLKIKRERNSRLNRKENLKGKEMKKAWKERGKKDNKEKDKEEKETEIYYRWYENKEPENEFEEEEDDQEEDEKDDANVDKIDSGEEKYS